jgi:cell division protein FtsB
VGDTQYAVGRDQETPFLIANITIEQIGTLMESKLEKNNKNITNDLKLLIHTEIDAALQLFNKEIVEKKHNSLALRQETLDRQIQATNEKIQVLESENLKLKSQLEKLNSNPPRMENTTVNDSQKKFILYGLDEWYGENEMDLYPRINYMFSDILNIEINGFIESAKRIGKKGNRRPIVIELISYRMKKYVLANAHRFRNTGNAVSDILDKEALEKRKYQREMLIRARRNGEHAVIRGNKLYINGAEYKQSAVPAQPILEKKSPIPDPRANSTNHSIQETPHLEGQGGSATARENDQPFRG